MGKPLAKVAKAAVCLVTVVALAPTAQAAKPPPKRPPVPNAAFPSSDPLRPPAVEAQGPNNGLRVPDRRDRVAISTGREYCKPGPRNGQFAGTHVGGKSFSASLKVTGFCHKRNEVYRVGVSTDHQIYGTYNIWMRFDHESIEKGFYNWRQHGNRSGYFVRAKSYFMFCYEPTRSICTKTYTIYLRNYVHADGTWSTYRTIMGI